MKKALMIFVVSLFTASMLWAGQPELVKAEITPAKAKNGEKVTLKVEFTGKAKDIQMVEIMVRENPYEAPEMFLDPVKDSDKNEFSLSVQVPIDAPIGDYNLEVKALGSDGKEIVTEEFKNQQWGKAGLIEFKIVE